MRTYTEQAQEAWGTYGRIDRRGRIYLAGEYIGRIGTTDQGNPMTFCVGETRVGYLGIQPVAVTAAHLMR